MQNQNLTLSIPHQLTRLEAKQRIQSHMAQLKQQYGSYIDHFQESWNGDTLSFSLSVTGIPISGHVYVEDQAVRVEVPLPWPLAMLIGGVRQQIEQQGRRLLGKS
jgi:hypothetical protein